MAGFTHVAGFLCIVFIILIISYYSLFSHTANFHSAITALAQSFSVSMSQSADVLCTLNVSALLSFCVSDSYLCHFPPTPLHLILVNYTSSSKSPPASPLLLPLSRLLVLSCFIPLLDSIWLHSFTGA